jgi:heme/copper-type cytochrome/quinol oxidase subunit 2
MTRAWLLCVGADQNDKTTVVTCSEALKAERIFVTEHAFAVYSPGIGFYGLKSYESAVADCTESLKLIPTAIPACNNRGIALGKTGKLEAAIADFGAALEKKSDNAPAYANRATYKDQLGPSGSLRIGSSYSRISRPLISLFGRGLSCLSRARKLLLAFRHQALVACANLVVSMVAWTSMCSGVTAQKIPAKQVALRQNPVEQPVSGGSMEMVQMAKRYWIHHLEIAKLLVLSLQYGKARYHIRKRPEATRPFPRMLMNRLSTAAAMAALLVFGVLAGTEWVRADQPSTSLPNELSKVSKEAVDLLTAPRQAPADLTIKIVGDRRHWSYEYTNPLGPAFTSAATAATTGQTDTDADIVVPQGKSVELLVTANDQVYELIIRELAVALTAIPGRLQSYRMITNKVGRLVAACSSSCEAAERADTIAIRVVSPEDYEQWLHSKMGQKP